MKQRSCLHGRNKVAAENGTFVGVHRRSSLGAAASYNMTACRAKIQDDVR
jgi:hypothetical protein